MSFKNMKIRFRMLLFFVTAIVAVMLAVVMITTNLTQKAVTTNLKSSLEVMSRNITHSVTAGLEFGDPDEVASAVKAYTTQKLFSYISILDSEGKEIYHYRKAGLDKVSQTTLAELTEIPNEMFDRVPIKSSSGQQIGTVTLGISLDGRNKILGSTRRVTLILSFVITVVFVILTVVIANTISKPIDTITSLSEKLAHGDLNQDISINRGDEIGSLADSFREMIKSQKDKAEVANQIAQGNLSIDVEAKSAEDVLGQAMITMKESLNRMLRELQTTIDAQKSGDIDARCRPEKFKGAYADLLNGVNDTLDAVIHPLSEGIDILHEYAVGDLQKEMRDLPGKQFILTDGLNTIRKNFRL
ncbi:MAG: HAMP domain-containing protein [bacterium]